MGRSLTAISNHGVLHVVTFSFLCPQPGPWLLVSKRDWLTNFPSPFYAHMRPTKREFVKYHP